MQETMGTGLRAEALAGGLLIVQFRQGGERFRPAGHCHSQELKKLLQQAGIPPWERERLPLVYGVIAGGSNHPGAARHPSLSKEEGKTDYLLLAVVGLGIAADFAAKSGKTGWQPDLRIGNPTA
jgi:tRNA(Ile)-lysidine synthase